MLLENQLLISFFLTQTLNATFEICVRERILHGAMKANAQMYEAVEY
jgi:hypothetical protein